MLLDNPPSFISLQESFIKFIRMWKAISKGPVFVKKGALLEEFSKGTSAMGRWTSGPVRHGQHVLSSISF